MLLLIMGGLLLVIVLIRALTSPVILKIGEGPLAGDRRLVLLSPFRDREPEKVAEAFLNRLKKGECRNAISPFGWNAKKQETICQRELFSPISSVRLIDRTDHPKDVTLRYIWFGPEPERLGSFLNIQVGGSQGQMKIIDYARYY